MTRPDLGPSDAMKQAKRERDETLLDQRGHCGVCGESARANGLCSRCDDRADGVVQADPSSSKSLDERESGA